MELKQCALHTVCLIFTACRGNKNTCERNVGKLRGVLEHVEHPPPGYAAQGKGREAVARIGRRVDEQIYVKIVFVAISASLN